MRSSFSRIQAIQRARDCLEAESYPRLQMAFLVVLTGAAGFLASHALLHAGMLQMGLRYFVAVAIAYCVFLGLLWLWLRSSASDYADVPDLSGLIPSPCSVSQPPSVQGRGGSFDGGGASGDYTAGEGVVLEASEYGPVGDALANAAEGEELAIPLVVLVLIGAALLSSLLVVYSAPLLFAELLVDGVLAAGLYRRLRGLEQRHWLETAVRRTFWLFLLTACCAAAAGLAMSWYVPAAVSIGEVLLHTSQ